MQSKANATGSDIFFQLGQKSSKMAILTDFFVV